MKTREKSSRGKTLCDNRIRSTDNKLTEEKIQRVNKIIEQLSRSHLHIFSSLFSLEIDRNVLQTQLGYKTHIETLGKTEGSKN